MKLHKFTAYGCYSFLVAALLSALPQAATSEMAFTTFDSGGFGSNFCCWVVEGFTFTPNVDIFVTEMGMFDGTSNGVGLSRAYTLGIVATDDTVLGQTVVPAGTAAPLEGPFDPGGLQAGSGFRYAPLVGGPLALSANVTYAAALVSAPGQSDAIPGAPGVTVNSAIAFLGSAIDCCGAENNSLRFPDEFVSIDLAINFKFTTTLVPLPAALPLFGAGLGLMSLFGSWRRRRPVAA